LLGNEKKRERERRREKETLHNYLLIAPGNGMR